MLKKFFSVCSVHDGLFLSPQAAMCYVHVAALVAEYLNRKSKVPRASVHKKYFDPSWHCVPSVTDLLETREAAFTVDLLVIYLAVCLWLAVVTMCKHSAAQWSRKSKFSQCRTLFFRVSLSYAKLAVSLCNPLNKCVVDMLTTVGRRQSLSLKICLGFSPVVCMN